MLSLQDAVVDLSAFRETKDRAHANRRWEIADLIASSVDSLPYDAAASLYDCAFQMLWQCQEDYKQTQYDIYDRLILPIWNKMPKVKPREKGSKPERFVYLCAQAQVSGPYANMRTMLSVLRGVENPQAWSVFIYGPHEKSVLNELARRGFDVWIFDGDPFQKFSDIKQACNEIQPDVIITDMHWFLPLSVYASGLAPLFAYYSPGYQCFPSDLVIYPDTQESFVNRSAAVPFTIGADFLPGNVKHIPDEKYEMVFGTMARHAKVSDEFKDSVTQILKRHQKSVYKLYGAGPLEPWHDRVQIMGVAKPAEALAHIDIFLDTFPLCGCCAVIEAMSAGVPCVTLTVPATRSYDKYKVGVVKGIPEYHGRVDALAEYPEARAIQAMKGRELIANVTDCEKGAAALMGAITWHWTHTAT